MRRQPAGDFGAGSVPALALVGLVGVLAQAAALLVGPLLRPEISLVHGAISQYAVGPWSFLQNIGFVALGVGSFALAIALAVTPLASRWAVVGSALLMLAGTACVGLAAFPMDAPGPATVLGDAHQTTGTLAVAFHLSALLALALAFWADPGWRSLCVPAALLGALALTGALLTQAELTRPELPIPFGVAMRLMVVPVLIWWIMVGLRLRAGPAVGHNGAAAVGAGEQDCAGGE